MDAKTKRREALDLKQLADNIAAWERFGRECAANGNIQTARTHGHDVVDLRTIVAAVKAGDYGYARTIAVELETAARDQVPTRLYNRLLQVG
jgi:hypothetical protein